MKLNFMSTRFLRILVAAGYLLMCLLAGGIMYLWHYEWKEIEALETENQRINNFRQEIHHVYGEMTGLSLLGESVLEWEDEDLEHYHIRRMAVDSMLCRFKTVYPARQIDSVRHLLESKERLLQGIVEVLDEQESLNQRIAERVPVIAARSAQEQKRQGQVPIFVRQGAAYQEIKRRVRLVAPTRLGVLICGENGTGKEHIARYVHTQSKRAEKPFVTVDCGALSPTLAQSAFFGHVKGAFTGADSAHVGYFQEAEGGTLFLDEVGNLPMEMQRMLLRVIQEHRYRPIGAKEDKTADVRIVAATNDDLQKAVTEKRFREDLLYRLKEYTITVPPLRDCQEDILPLAEFFLGLANKELERNIKGFNASANNILLAYPWPGNVRELKQKIQTAVLHAEGNMITDNDLELGREQLSSFPSSFALKSEAEEKERIIRALEQAKGKRHLAAKLLGIGRTTLYKKMKEYGIEL